MTASLNPRILDAPPDERFDGVTWFACRLFNAPIALVSLVDHHRQWFKSRQGLAASEAGRATPACDRVILPDGPGAVPDSQRVARFPDQSLVGGARRSAPTPATRSTPLPVHGSKRRE
jgi:hypothetical protein